MSKTCSVHEGQPITHSFCGVCMEDIHKTYSELETSKKLTAQLTDKCRDHEIRIGELERELMFKQMSIQAYDNTVRVDNIKIKELCNEVERLKNLADERYEEIRKLTKVRENLYGEINKLESKLLSKALNSSGWSEYSELWDENTKLMKSLECFRDGYIFIQHIKNHLKNDGIEGEIQCKICDKFISQIVKEEGGIEL